MKDLKQGAFYWVRIVPDANTSEQDKQPMPARFTGQSGGSPPRLTWDFLGQPSAVEVWKVDWVGPEIVLPDRIGVDTVR